MRANGALPGHAQLVVYAGKTATLHAALEPLNPNNWGGNRVNDPRRAAQDHTPNRRERLAMNTAPSLTARRPIMGAGENFAQPQLNKLLGGTSKLGFSGDQSDKLAGVSSKWARPLVSAFISAAIFRDGK